MQQTIQQSDTLKVNGTPLIITSPNPPEATSGIVYSFQYQAEGGIPVYTWSIISGYLPEGLTLNASGLLSGIPTSIGKFYFTIQVVDSDV